MGIKILLRRWGKGYWWWRKSRAAEKFIYIKKSTYHHFDLEPHLYSRCTIKEIIIKKVFYKKKIYKRAKEAKCLVYLYDVDIYSIPVKIYISSSSSHHHHSKTQQTNAIKPEVKERKMCLPKKDHSSLFNCLNRMNRGTLDVRWAGWIEEIV